MNRLQIPAALVPLLAHVFYGDPGADRIVPPSGFTSRLVLMGTAAMAFLAVFALALASATARLGESWQTELAGTATLLIEGPPEIRDRDTETALALLRSTPGIAEARVLGDLEQQALLAPWFGRDLPLDALPLPRLIALTAAPEGYDPKNLALRLAGELPEARFDDHDRWRAPLAETEARIGRVIWAALGLIAAALAAVTALAAQAAMAANAQVIETLRLVGARDVWIARAFVRRITLRALGGSALGAAAALVTLLWFPAAGPDGLPGLRPAGAAWLAPAIVPPLAAAAAFVTARLSALAMLRARP